jgi:hypothetical protein
MPIPQVNDRIKEAPVVVLRAVFAGIGQILLTADKVRARAAEQAWTPDRATALGPSCRPAAAPPAPGPRNGTLRSEPAVAGPTVTEPAVAGPAVAGPTVTEPAVAGPAVAGPTVTEPAVAGPAVTEPAAVAEPPASREAPQGTGTAAQAAAPAAKATKTAKAAKAAKTAKTVPAPRPGTAEPAAEAPPLPGYDDLSLASLRARLRVLDAAQIRAMLAYERAHARREPVITMLERRLAKITAG